MADLTITAASVGVVNADVVTTIGQVGETVTQMQPVYLKSSDSKYWLASNDVDDDSADVFGVTLSPASADGYAVIATNGDIIVGATVAATTEYVVSDTAGKIMPKTDLTTGQRYTRLFFGLTTTTARLDIDATTVQAP